MKLSNKKLVLLLAIPSLIVGCAKPGTISSNNNQTSNQVSESSSKNSQNSQSETTSAAPQSSAPISVTSVNYNPHDCTNHQLSEEIKTPATLLEKGVKHYHCNNCGADFDADYYKMDEFVFEDMSFMYDGNDHKVQIEGVLPYGVSVIYENNSRKEIGEQEATAKFVDSNNNLLLEKKAKINIVENIGLPNVKIVTTDGDDPDWSTREYESMKVSIDNCESQYIKTNVTGTIKVRGNSTNQREVTKRAWRLKLDGKTNLLGLNNGIKEKSWVLLADFFDQSMFRNESAFSMGNDLFNYSGFYSSDFKHVNVYMNGENRGVYLLAEQQQAKKERIPIHEAEEGETTPKTGYLIEIDGLVTQQGHVDSQTHIGELEGDPCFTTGTGSGGGMWGGWGGWGGQGGSDSINGVNIQDKGYAVKTDVYGDEQVPFIRDYMNNALKVFKGVLKGEKHQIIDENGELQDSPYTTQYETLNASFDLDSFFRMYLLQEFMKNFDVGWGSFYLYIDFSVASKVKRLTLAAPWDFDLGGGNKTSGNITKTNDNFLNNSEYANGMTTANPWLYMLSQCDFFPTMFKKYYSIFCNSGIYEQMMDRINYESKAFASAFDYTYTKYNLKSAPDCGMSCRKYSAHNDAVNYLTKWYQDRKTYLDQTWGK